MSCLTSVTPDRGFERQGRQVVHESSFHPEAPQRDGAKLVGRVLRTSLNDTVAGSHIVQQEIAERMNDLIAEGVRHHENAAVQHRSGGSGGHRLHMADVTTDAFEKMLACLRV